MEIRVADAGLAGWPQRHGCAKCLAQFLESHDRDWDYK